MIYLDNAATTRTPPEVVRAMMPYLTDFYGNPSASYDFGNRAWQAVQEAREIVAEFIGADPSEIIFTSGGTEADNMAIKWLSNYNSTVTSNIEHKAVLNSAKHTRWLKSLVVNENGVVQFNDDIASEGNIVSVMMANNELGTIQPIEEIAKVCHENGAVFHTDAVQVFGHMPIDVKKIGVDMLSASGHKMGAPKGVGFLYLREGVYIPPFIDGGGQENFMRSGTENVPAIVGLGRAVEIVKHEMNDRFYKTKELRDIFEKMILEIGDVKINGYEAKRLPGHSNITFYGIRAEEMLEYLNIYGICASSGSACNTGDEKPSHVLKAIGLTDAEANATLRFTLNHENTIEELIFTVTKIKEFLDIKRPR